MRWKSSGSCSIHCILICDECCIAEDCCEVRYPVSVRFVWVYVCTYVPLVVLALLSPSQLKGALEDVEMLDDSLKQYMDDDWKPERSGLSWRRISDVYLRPLVSGRYSLAALCSCLLWVPLLFSPLWIMTMITMTVAVESMDDDLLIALPQSRDVNPVWKEGAVLHILAAVLWSKKVR